MNDERLTEKLATQLLGWKSAPDRFIKPGRSWTPRSRFKPLVRLEDAFLLLDRAGGTYVLSVGPDGVFRAEVRVGERIGKATGGPKARAIAVAISRALGIGAV